LTNLKWKIRYGKYRSDSPIQFRKFLAEILELGQIVVNDVSIIRMVSQIVLVVGLSFMESVERRELRRQDSGKHLRLIKLIDIRLRDALLLVSRIENRRTILCAGVRTLPVYLSRIVGHGKENFEQLSISYL